MPNTAKRILLAGLCPLPFENTSQNYGPGIRTWQFAVGLRAAGCRVRLVAMTIPGVYGDGELRSEEVREGVEIHRVDGASYLDGDALPVEIERFAPDALVGATIYGSLAAVRTGTELPLWCDQFGHVMAEAQAKASLESSNWPLPRWWRMVQPVMSRADRVSVVSERQRYAAIGELGALGRLSAETCGYEFTAVVPCGLSPRDEPVRPLLRGGEIPHDAFIVLWSGGFNVWSDVDTLFQGLTAAMLRDETIHFVSTGGAIEGHDSDTYARFLALVEGSSLRRRFHLQGWVKRELVASHLAEADLGVLTDLPIYEGLLGSKNRIVEWMAVGLPAVYNRQGDLGELLEEEELGLVFPVGDAAALADRVVWAAGHRRELDAMAVRAREKSLRDFSYEATTRELATWALAPARSPDADLPRPTASPLDFERPDPRHGVEEARAAAQRHGARRPWWRRALARLR
ncbi:MAG: glycosyltransferase [Thermoanaerobaculia bacterium]